MSVYTKLLGVGGTSVGGTRVAYRTPAGCTAIAKTVLFFNSGSAERTFYVDMPLGPVSTWAAYFVKIAPQAHHEWQTWTVIPEGWALGVGAVGDGNWFYWVSGSELEGLPPTPTLPALASALDVATPMPASRTDAPDAA